MFTAPQVVQDTLRKGIDAIAGLHMQVESNLHEPGSKVAVADIEQDCGTRSELHAAPRPIDIRF